MHRWIALVGTILCVQFTSAQDSRPIDIVVENLAGALDRIGLVPSAADFDDVEVVAFSIEGELVAVGDERGRIAVYRVAGGETVMSAKIAASNERWKGKPIQPYVNGSGRRIRGLFFSDDATRITAWTGAGDVVRFFVATGEVEKRGELDITAKVVDVDRTHGRFVVGDGGGTVAEYDVGTFVKGRVYQSTASELGLSLVRYVEGDKALLTAHENYSRPAASGSVGGAADDRCLTRWSTIDGKRLVSYGGPEGGASAVEDPISGIVYAGSDRGEGPAAFKRGGEPLPIPEFVGCPVGLLVTEKGRFTVGMSAGKIDIRDLSGQRWLATDDPRVRYKSSTLTVASKGDRFALGLSNGGVVVYRFLPRDGRPFVELKRGRSVKEFGLMVTPSARFFGHTDEILEIAVAPSGQTVVSRDGAGKIVLWRKNGAGAFEPRVLNLLVKDAHRGMRAFSFTPGESSLCVVTDERSLRFIALDDTGTAVDLVVKNGDRKVAVMTAVELGRGRLAVSSVDGGLFLVEKSSGRATATLVPDDTSTSNPPPSSPFTSLVPLDDGRSFLAVPHEISSRIEPLKKEEDLWRVRRFRVDDAASEAIATIPPMGRIGVMRLGGAIVLADGWDNETCVVLKENDLEATVRDFVSADGGLAALTTDVGLAASKRGLSLVRWERGELTASPLELELELGPQRVVASSPSAGRAYIGLKTGMIVELEIGR